MQQDFSNGNAGGNTGSEDNSRAVEHVHNAEENRDALEAQARRTEATTPPEIRADTDRDRGGTTTGGTGRTAGGANLGNQGSEDPSQAAAHAHNAAENRDALEEQARRTEATTPPDQRAGNDPDRQ